MTDDDRPKFCMRHLPARVPKTWDWNTDGTDLEPSEETITVCLDCGQEVAEPKEQQK